MNGRKSYTIPKISVPLPSGIFSILKSSVVARVLIRAFIHMGSMKRTMVTADLFSSRLESIHAAG